jgi:hypothetical protein
MLIVAYYFSSVQISLSNYSYKTAQRRLSKGNKMRKISSRVIVWTVKFLLLEICYGHITLRISENRMPKIEL